eukprot:scaffold108994_cov18-Tisochrysis_lutea.AAC.1
MLQSSRLSRSTHYCPRPKAYLKAVRAAMDSQPAQEKPIRRIAVFCGSSSGVSPLYGECARKMGSLLASR